MRAKILLIDGFNILFRGFYALPLLTNSQGEYTNAVYGFMNIFLKFYEEEKPDLIAVAFDLPGPTFRHKKYEPYKATRSETPPEFAPQIPLLVSLLGAMNIPIVSSPGYEADDVLGTLAKLASEKGYEAIIISGDRDLLQVASETIKIRMPKTYKGKTTVEDYNAADVQAKYGISPTAFIDLKALMGDTSDNVPGVPSIGEVTATKIIKAYGSVENAIAHAHEIKPKRASENLITYAEQALLSKELVSIVTNVPLDFNFDAPPADLWNEKALAEAQRLDFKSLVSRFKGNRPWGSAPHPAGDSSPDPIILHAGIGEHGLKDVSFFWDVKRAGFRGVRGVRGEDKVFDAMLASYVLNDPLDELSEGEIALAYPEMRRRLAENGQALLYDEIELPLAFVLADMEQHGIKVDREALINYGRALDIQLDSLTAEIYQLAGEEFNILSPSQLRVILFEKLGLKGTKKTKTGYSTAADVLEELKEQHPLIPKILAFRTHAKLKSTYVDGLLPLIDPQDSRIRSTFNQALTATGRISSAEPNLQNIPIRTSLGRELRKVFIAEEGCIFVDADYSQIELRVLAHMSGDTALINAFHEGQDIHKLTASQVFHTPIDEVQDYQRHAAKAVNFGIIYGISAHGLVQDLSISHTEAQMYIDSYFRQYPGVKEFMARTIAEAKEKGYVSTIFNRRRPMPELNSRNYATRSFGERAAMNMPIQGTAADIIKIAMVRTSARLRAQGFESRLILQVHDELLLEVKNNELDDVRTLLKEEMEGAVELAVPLLVELHEGVSWYEAK